MQENKRSRFDLSKSTTQFDLSKESPNISGKEKRKYLYPLIIIVFIAICITAFSILKKNIEQKNLISETHDSSNNIKQKTEISRPERNIDMINSTSSNSDSTTTPVTVEINNQSTNKQKSAKFSVGNKYLVYQFEYNKNNFDKPTKEMLDLATELKLFPDMNILITAYTDNIGSVQFNNNLSKHRAKAICDFLIAQGIDKDRLLYRGMGISNKFDNTTENGRQKNRRAEFELTT